MKKLLIFLSLLLIIISFPGCEKAGEKVVIKDTIASNNLNALSASSYVLLLANAANTFQTFTWTAPDYGFYTVATYTVQVDKTSDNFATPYDVVTVTSARSVLVTIGDLNKVLLAMGLPTETPAALQFRVKTVINSNVEPVYSNVLAVTISPYAVVFPPIYMVGDALGGWDWTKDVVVRSTAPNIYSTIAYFTQNGAFRFFKQTDWNPTSYNYLFFTGSVSTNFVNANDGDKNLKVVSATGYYRVTVNMTTKSVDLVSVPQPKLYMTGAALGGWDWTTNDVQLTWLSDGMFSATAHFISGQTFRFFAQADWGPTSYNYPYFAGGTIPAVFTNANDGDKNFQFNGTTGNYKVTVNFLDNIITMTAQ